MNWERRRDAGWLAFMILLGLIALVAIIAPGTFGARCGQAYGTGTAEYRQCLARVSEGGPVDVGESGCEASND